LLLLRCAARLSQFKNLHRRSKPFHPYQQKQQLCQEHGISKDGMLEEYASQVRSRLDGFRFERAESGGGVWSRLAPPAD
jgi:hypothetical protein